MMWFELVAEMFERDVCFVLGVVQQGQQGAVGYYYGVGR